MVTAAFLLLSLTACGTNEGEAQNEAEPVGAIEETVHLDQVDEEIVGENETQPVLSDYMQVKEAMVSDNYVLAKQAAADMLTSLKGSAYEEELEANVEELVGAQDIEGQRKAFEQLSGQLYQLAKNKELTGQTLYWQHCPMAMENSGASWLSFEKQVQNPYMGQQMPKCGRVQETLNN